MKAAYLAPLAALIVLLAAPPGWPQTTEDGRQWTCVPGDPGRWRCGDADQVDPDADPLPAPIVPDPSLAPPPEEGFNPFARQPASNASVPGTPAADDSAAGGYALQLVNVSDVESGRRFVADFQIDPEQVRVSTEPDPQSGQLAVIYGEYVDREQAQAAVAALPAMIRALQPQVIRVANLRGTLRALHEPEVEPETQLAQAPAMEPPKPGPEPETREPPSNPQPSPDSPAPTFTEDSPESQRAEHIEPVQLANAPPVAEAEPEPEPPAVSMDAGHSEPSEPSPTAAPDEPDPEPVEDRQPTQVAVTPQAADPEPGEPVAVPLPRLDVPQSDAPTASQTDGRTDTQTDTYTDTRTDGRTDNDIGQASEPPSVAEPEPEQPASRTPPPVDPRPTTSTTSSQRTEPPPATRPPPEPRPARPPRRDRVSEPASGPASSRRPSGFSAGVDPGPTATGSGFDAVDPAWYTIQLSSQRTLERVELFLSRLSLDRARIYRVRIDEGAGPRWLVLYGAFSTVAAANATIANLPAGVRSPWSRRIGPIQDGRLDLR